MTQLTLNGKSLLLVPVPDGTFCASQVHIYDGEDPVCFHGEDGEIISSMAVPKGAKLIGANPVSLTEEEAKEIVESISCKHFRDYCYNGSPAYFGAPFHFDTALESLSSLLRANGIEKGIILKQ